MARVIAATPIERTNRLVMLGAVLCAAIAALLIFVALQGRGGSEVSAGTATVVVASGDIEANTVLGANLLETRAVPSDQLIVGGYRDTADLIGLPARYPIQAGEQITASKVGVEAIENEKDLALVLEPGQRGFALRATEVTAVGGLILPGNAVDVIAVFLDDEGDVERAETVLQHIQVLSVAQMAQEPLPAPASGEEESQLGDGVRGQRPEELERQPEARSVTLGVSPDQAQFLAALQTQDGVEIWLSLRPVDDDADVPLDATNLLHFHSPLSEPELS